MHDVLTVCVGVFDSLPCHAHHSGLNADVMSDNMSKTVKFMIKEHGTGSALINI